MGACSRGLNACKLIMRDEWQLIAGVSGACVSLIKEIRCRNSCEYLGIIALLRFKLIRYTAYTDETAATSLRIIRERMSRVSFLRPGGWGGAILEWKGGKCGTKKIKVISLSSESLNHRRKALSIFELVCSRAIGNQSRDWGDETRAPLICIRKEFELFIFFGPGGTTLIELHRKLSQSRGGLVSLERLRFRTPGLHFILLSIKKLLDIKKVDIIKELKN